MSVTTRRLYVALTTLLSLFGANLAQAGFTWNQCEYGYDRGNMASNDKCANLCYSPECDRVAVSCFLECREELAANQPAETPGTTSLRTTSSQPSGPQNDCECIIAGGRWNYDSRTCIFVGSGSGGGSGGESTAQEQNDFGQSTNTQLGLGTGQTNTSFYGVNLPYY
ncbi:MAG TPA: hypothetical protein PK095_22870 [Myxococcota bacterium]|nr:hypothetical protein [Myxococcota bacterium]